MSDLWLPASIAAAAVALTYFFCVRPMRHGHCGMVSSTSGKQIDQELAEARAALADQQASDRCDSGVAASGPPRSTAPTER